MKPRDFKVSDYYVSKWKGPDNYFHGVVKIIPNNVDYENYVFAEVIKVFESSTPTWSKGWKFYLVPNQLKNKITDTTHPEYFI